MQFVTDIERTHACAYVETEWDKADEVVAVVKTPHGTEKTFSSTTKQDGRFRLNMAFEKPDCIDDIHLWTVAHPKLYETTLYVKKNGEVLDEIETYFAFRKIHTEKGRVYINDVPVELRMSGDLYAVQVGPFRKRSEAIGVENQLQMMGYDTLLVEYDSETEF